MRGTFCSDCKILVRGSPREVKEHFTSFRHKQNHEKSIKEKRKVAQAENKYAHLKEKKPKPQQEPESGDAPKPSDEPPSARQVFEKDIKGNQVFSKQDMMDLINEGDAQQKSVWRKVLDFAQNSIYYENLLTGDKSETLPFGVIDSELEVYAFDDDPLQKREMAGWTEVVPEDRFFDRVVDDNDNIIDSKMNMMSQAHQELDDKMDEIFERNKGDIRQSVKELLNTAGGQVSKFELLENLAKQKISLDLSKKVTKANDNGNGKQSSETIGQPKSEELNLLFRKKKIEKANKISF
jgi:hypothetical protein